MYLLLVASNQGNAVFCSCYEYLLYTRQATWCLLSRGHMTTATCWGSDWASQQRTTADLSVLEVAVLLGRPECLTKLLICTQPCPHFAGGENIQVAAVLFWEKIPPCCQSRMSRLAIGDWKGSGNSNNFLTARGVKSTTLTLFCKI